ncbi:hypothetical protein AVEN_6978-1 [Araneus ventricosus]|uniref:Uncharacterized protein n=1 Tax=Araneus ventricosus TaxID=182803 RepID=A0A4Y2DSU7_ARAVE|nr:hypothetical protein AVEN_6978-1 [Araneus ventricosus]
MKCCGGLVLKCRLLSRVFQIRNPIRQKIHRVLSLLNDKSYVGVKLPLTGEVRKLGEGLPPQMCSSSPDHGPNCLILSQNALELLQNWTLKQLN